jgi:hypothetical protein
MITPDSKIYINKQENINFYSHYKVLVNSHQNGLSMQLNV